MPGTPLHYWYDCALSAVGFLEVIQQIEDLIGRRSQFPDDFAVVWILLLLEGAARLIDITKTFGDLLSLGVRDPEHTVRRLRLVLVRATTGVAVAAFLA